MRTMAWAECSTQAPLGNHDSLQARSVESWVELRVEPRKALPYALALDPARTMKI